MTTSEYRQRIEARARRSGVSARLAAVRANHDAEQEVLGVLIGKYPSRTMPISPVHHGGCNDLCSEHEHHLCGDECE